ncbi:hypothetical protein JO84_gp327 [Aureococcus anophagefferens virus]|uniref:Transmembrane protein n=1 Tax=Aureococcus anophagefferens virus TaxID=1474867 RepID=A0A076FG18_9VIRU|nr:hypothetical protein JO84_gp327 [Aureococcus anophagefferens virus]AII16965.1 hypothetical protein AaV_146 [Aureococcus anophagefferens virus]UOG94060.1 hypothetical protein MKD35_18 [Aureococcus anophagefferens virus]UOG94061.1 hypothetical protein MKD35_19 [Aureococcus anophagefferens virus]
MYTDIFNTFFVGTFGVVAAYFIIAIIIAILVSIVFGGYTVYKLGDDKNDDLKKTYQIIGYVIMAIGGIPLFIYFLPMFFQGLSYGLGRIAAESLINEFS